LRKKLISHRNSKEYHSFFGDWHADSFK